MKNNYSVLYATTIPKQLKKQQKNINGLHLNPYTNTLVASSSSRKRQHSAINGDQSEEEVDDSIPSCSGLSSSALDMLVIVSGSVDGNLVIYNKDSKQENLTFKYTSYPSFFNPVVSHDGKYCLIQVFFFLFDLSSISRRSLVDLSSISRRSMIIL